MQHSDYLKAKNRQKLYKMLKKFANKNGLNLENFSKNPLEFTFVDESEYEYQEGDCKIKHHEFTVTKTGFRAKHKETFKFKIYSNLEDLMHKYEGCVGYTYD